MGLDSVTSTAIQKNFPLRSDKQDIKPIDIPVSDGEFLKLEEILQKVVMQALGTDDPAKADEFIKQSGFEFGEKLPVKKEENGKSFYRFEPTEDFRKSIESFQQTGKAITLGESKNDVNGGRINTDEQAKNAVEQKKIDGVKIKANMPPPLKDRQVKYEPLAPKIYNRNANGFGEKKFNPNDWIKVELDPKDFVEVTQKKGQKPQVKVLGDGDPRREMYEKALNKAFRGKVDQSIINESLNGKTDANSVFYVGSDDQMAFETVKAGLTDAAVKKESFNFYISKTQAKEFGRTQIEKFGTEQQKLQLKIDDGLKAIDEKYDRIDIKDNLQKFALGLARTVEKKNLIDELVGNSKIDFRDDSNKTGDSYADGFEKGVRTFLEMNPLYNVLPDSAKQQLVNYGVGLGKGTVSLAGSAAGVDNFVRDTFQDVLISGMDKIGIDTSNIEKSLSTSRQNEQQKWSEILNSRTKEMANGDYSISTKNAYGFETKLADLKWSVKAGDMTAQAVPFFVIGAVTGGATVPLAIQMAASGATSGAIALGGTYVQTGDKTVSLKSAAWATAQGAVNPLTAKLPFPADVVANAATGYIFAKLENPNADDAEIAQSMILQTAQAGAFKIGSKLHEVYSQKVGRTLNETEVEQRYKKDVSENLKVINDEINKSANRNSQKVVDEVITKSTSNDNAKVIDNKVQGNARRAELEAKLNKVENRKANQVKENRVLSDDKSRAEFKKKVSGYDYYAKEIDKLKMKRPELKDIPTEDLVAVKIYTGGIYDSINTALRTKNPSELKVYEPHIICATSGLNQLPSYKGVAYRSLNLDGLPDVLAKYKKGEIVTEEAFLSSSFEEGGAFPNKDTLMIIKSKNGKEISFLSNLPNEKEVLFKPESKFKVTEVTFDQDTGKRVIFMEEVGGNINE